LINIEERTGIIEAMLDEDLKASKMGHFCFGGT